MPRSSIPRSSQPGLHPRLDDTVIRHLKTVWEQPLRGFSRAAFESLSGLETGEIVIDAGCGTGQSTLLLAQQFPNSVVIGVDRSAARLSKAGELPNNAILLRADLADFWRLARAAGWRVKRHYLYYPNPWPKPGHLKRRWHAHPVWPDLLGLGGRLEMRTNFEIYAREFARALKLAGSVPHLEVLTLRSEEAVSPFEHKYLQSGHELFKVWADIV
jgi:tRNA G46 methylase TrmB